MSYRFDIDRWIAHQLPMALRRRTLYAFLRALLAPVKSLYRSFLSFREAADRQLSYNAFTNYLQKWLNGLFYYDGDVIYITDENNEKFSLAFTDEAYDEVYVSGQEEEPAVPAVLASSEPDDVVGSFVVHVPSSLSDAQVAEVARWVDFYKYAGTQYRIETYEYE